jgi:hypothetical protein
MSRALSRSERQRLESGASLYVATAELAHEVGMGRRGRTAEMARRLKRTARTIRRHCVIIRKFDVHLPPALPGRPPRTDYSGSRRGFRRRRGGVGTGRVQLDPWARAARAVARVGDDVQEIVRVMRTIAEQWPRTRWTHMNETQAASAVRRYLEQGGQLGPEAEAFWRREVRTLPIHGEGVHTPWLAAVSPRHLGPWLEHRRSRERVARRERELERREAASDRDAARRPMTAEEVAARVAAARQRMRGPP